MAPVHPRIGVEYRQNTAVATFTDEKILEEKDIQAIADSIMSLVDEEQVNNIVLDFSNVSFLSSAVLGLLIRLLKKVSENGGKLALCNISAKIHDIFKITRLTKVFSIHPDIDQALESMKNQQ